MCWSPPQLYSGPSCWQLGTDRGRNVFTIENGKCDDFRFFVGLLVGFLKSWLFNFHQHTLGRTQGERENIILQFMAISLHQREVQRALERESRDLSSRPGFASKGS